MFKFELDGNLRGGKKYERARQNLISAMRKKVRMDLVQSLDKFEDLLANERVRSKETSLLEQAHELDEYLRDLESVLFSFVNIIFYFKEI